MNGENRVIDIGVVTAYGAAKSAGYTGTYEEFCEEIAHFAEAAQQVARDKGLAAEYARQAELSSGDAVHAAGIAGQYADDANDIKRETEQIRSQSERDALDAASAAREAVRAEGAAKGYAQDIEDLDVDAITLEADSDAYATKSKSGNNPYHIEFGIPKGDKGDKGDTGNVNFATFGIDENGILNVYYDEDYTGPEFQINTKGYLEVLV